MTPLLPNHALPFFGPARAGDYGGVPWERASSFGCQLTRLVQRPWHNQLAVFGAGVRVAILTADVDDDTDGPGGSPEIDPCWQPDTSLCWEDGSSIDSREFRGMVMHRLVQARGGGLGDLGMVCWDGVLHCVQYYDIGPTTKTQEGAEKTLRDTGVIEPGQSSRHAAVVGNDVQDFCSLIFLGSAPKLDSGRPFALPQDELITRTLRLFNAFTGRTAGSEK